MGFSINSKAQGAGFAYQAQKNQQELSESLLRIASGQKINKAADDAAGMVIADRLASQAQGMAQASQNASEAVSITKVADGALDQATELVQDIRVKAIQAAGPAQSAESRQAIQADIDSSLKNLSQISDTTSYNGQKLLSGAFSDQSFQTGASAGETLEMSLGSISPDQISDGQSGLLSNIDVTSQEGAQGAIEAADEALSYLASQRASEGSDQNQLESSISNLSVTRINTLAAESDIRDLDLAEEIINMNQLKLKARAAGFAQAQAGEADKQIIDTLE